MKRWVHAIVPLLFAAISAYYVFRCVGSINSFVSFGKFLLFTAGVVCNVIHSIRLLREECSESLNFLKDACLVLDFLITLFVFGDLLLWVLTVAFFTQG